MTAWQKVCYATMSYQGLTLGMIYVIMGVQTMVVNLHTKTKLNICQGSEKKLGKLFSVNIS